MNNELKKLEQLLTIANNTCTYYFKHTRRIISWRQKSRQRKFQLKKIIHLARV